MPITQIPPSGVIDNLTAPAPNAGGVGVGTAWLAQFRSFVAQIWGALFEAAATLASDSFSPVQAAYVLTPESGATDNLATIGAGYDGMVLRIRPATGKTITVKDAAGGAGQILIADAADFVLSDPTMRLVLIYSASATAWIEEDRMYGGNKAGFTAWLNAATSSLGGIIKAASIATTRTGTATDAAVTPDALASLWQKGVDIASAATLTKPADTDLGGYHVITGTTQVQAMWAGTTPGESYLFECAAALPVKNGVNLVTKTGGDMTFVAGDRFWMMYFGSSVWKMIEVIKADGSSLTNSAPRGWISPDFAFSNNPITPNTKIDYSAGQMTDGGNTVTLNPTGGTIDLTTTGADALDTGTLAASTAYWLFIIAKADGTTKGLASLSRTAPTMPSGYTVKRRCGAFFTDASTHVVAFKQSGRWFWLDRAYRVTTSPSLTGISSGATQAIAALPTGKRWPVKLRVVEQTQNSESGTVLYSADQTVQTPTPSFGSTGNDLADIWNHNNGLNNPWYAAAVKDLVTDVSSSFGIKSASSSAAVDIALIAFKDDGL